MHVRVANSRVGHMQPVQELPAHAPTLRRKPNGLVQQLAVPERKSSRELALEALILHLRVSSVSETKPPPRPLLEHAKLSATRKRAIEALAQKGWDMRQLIPHKRASTTDKGNNKQRYDCGFVASKIEDDEERRV